MAFYPDKKINNSWFTYKRKKNQHQNKQTNNQTKNPITKLLLPGTNTEMFQNIFPLVTHCDKLWGAGEHIFQFVRAVKPHSLKLQRWGFESTWWHYCDKTPVQLGGSDRLRDSVRTAHIYREQRSWKFIGYTQVVSNFCLQTPFVFQRFQHLFYLENGSSVEVILLLFLFQSTTAQWPWLLHLYSSGMALGIFSWL